ncbi:MAG: hypothetical protein WBN09_00965 [Woeseiaceae bacterium]
MRNEQQIRRLMQTGMGEPQRRSQAALAVSRARRQVGQRDTLTFALVRIWAALARMLAPFFALLGERQAQAAWQQSGRRAPRRKTDKNK